MISVRPSGWYARRGDDWKPRKIKLRTLTFGISAWQTFKKALQEVCHLHFCNLAEIREMKDSFSENQLHDVEIFTHFFYFSRMPEVHLKVTYIMIRTPIEMPRRKTAGEFPLGFSVPSIRCPPGLGSSQSCSRKIWLKIALTLDEGRLLSSNLAYEYNKPRLA